MKKSTISKIEDLFVRYPKLLCCRESIFAALKILIECYKNDGKLLICGNGGSAADSQHMVGELMKAFVLPRKLSEDKQMKIKQSFPNNCQYLIDNLQQVLPSVSLLGETALTSAYGNDKAPDLVFAQQVFGLGKPGDVFLGISTSGTSKNVLYACEIAKVQDMKLIGLTGETGGKMKEICDVAICVPSNVTFKIQEYHLPIYHALCMALEYEFFGEED
jgi:D-sedoheptulose 7-phosphate isomerase